MKPADYPGFFQMPPPEGRSRESTIVLDRQGRFWHDGERVTHPGMTQAFFSWIDRHPDDGRYILVNGYDFCYFAVEDVPFFVESVVIDGQHARIELSSGTEELLDPSTVTVGELDAVYLRVKEGRFDARLQPAAQTSLAPLLEPGPDGSPELVLGGHRYPIPPRS